MDKHIKELDIQDNFIGKISRFFVGRFQMVLLLIALIIGTGVSGAFVMPKESLPEIVFPAIMIQTIYPGASPEDVEQLITDKIESKMNDLDALDEIQSDSSFSFSSVALIFEEGTDMDEKKVEVESALSEIDFAQGIEKPKTMTFSTSEIPLLQISLSGPFTTFELTRYAKDIQEELEQMNGVKTVNLYGGLDREIHVNLNQTRLLEYGLSPSDVQQAISTLNIAIPIGDATLSNQRVGVRIDEEIGSTEALEHVLIATPKGGHIFLKDIAQVIDSNEEVDEYSLTYVRGKGGEMAQRAVFIEVLKKDDSDVIGLSKAVRDQIVDMAGDIYPKSVTVNISNDLSEYVKKDLDSIRSSAASGLIVVVLVLFLFIGFKESLIVSLTIPITLMATLAVLDFLGMSLNALSILGMIVALGLLVDNSIIVMENMDRLNRLGANARVSAIKGVNQVGFPVLAATLTTVAAFFPLAILPGIMGAFINTVPRTIIIALVASFGVAITITPSVYSRLLRNRSHPLLHRLVHFVKLDTSVATSVEKILSVLLVVVLAYYAFSGSATQINLGIIAALFFGILMTVKVYLYGGQGLEDAPAIQYYRKFVKYIIQKRRRRILVILIGISTLAASFTLIGAGHVKIAFFPDTEPESLQIIIDTPGGTPLEETARTVEAVEAYLKTVPDIAAYNITLGGTEVDKATISVIFTSDSDRQTDGFTILSGVEKAALHIPGARIIVNGSAGQGPPVGKPVSLKIIGRDLGEMRALANQYAQIYDSIDGVYNIDVDAQADSPQVQIDILEKKISSYGLTVAQIATQLRNQMDGLVAATINVEREEIDVVVKVGREEMADINALKSLYIVTPSSEMIPLSHIAVIKEYSGLSSIIHLDSERVITLEADLAPDVNINDVTGAFERLSDPIDIPSGIRTEYGGDIEAIQESFTDLFRSMLLAVFLVFIILSVQFNSVAQPFAILMTVPMAMIGVLLGLAVTGNEFGFYAFMGLVALVGIAVNDAIVLIDFMNYLRHSGSTLDAAILEAGTIRFNPVLATTLTTIGGVLPLAFRDTYYAQFSFSLVFGLLVTTILTLVYIPVFYHMIEGGKEKRAKRKLHAEKEA